jgi:glucose-fructose oxidoreductase
VKRKGKIRYAVVGLGYISQVAMLPAFAAARKNSVLAALVSGEREKLEALGAKYQIESLWSYDRYDELLGSGAIDAVYIGLPNTLHKDYAIRAAERGIHVLCDKPFTTSSADGEAVLEAARRGGAKIMVAYRLHFEPANLAAIEAIRSERIGPPRYFTAQFSMQVKDGNIRTKRELGGGPVFDLGIYCINAARQVFGAEPVSVHAEAARPPDLRFSEVEEMTAVTMRFSGERLAQFVASFGMLDVSQFQVWGTKGSLKVDDAFEMVGEKRLVVEQPGDKKPVSRRFGNRDQFAPLLLEFSDAIKADREPFPNGAEGVADIRVIEAIYRSIKLGAPVPVERGGTPTGDALVHRQGMKVPAHPKPELFHAEGPSS